MPVPVATSRIRCPARGAISSTSARRQRGRHAREHAGQQSWRKRGDRVARELDRHLLVGPRSRPAL